MDQNVASGACARKSVAVLGAARTGKTSLIKEFFTGNEEPFSTDYSPTVEDSYFHLVRMPDGFYYQLQVIDTGGAHSFPAMRDLCISTSDCFMLVFAYDSRESWHETLALYATIQRIKNEANPAVIFVANKSDLLEKEREVDEKHVRHMCETKLFCKFMSTSAKIYSRVNALYEEVLAQMWQYTQRRHSAETVAENDRRRFRSVLGLNSMLRRVSMAAAIPLRGGSGNSPNTISGRRRLSSASVDAGIVASSTPARRRIFGSNNNRSSSASVHQSTSMTIPDDAISPPYHQHHAMGNNFSFDTCELMQLGRIRSNTNNNSVDRRDSGNCSLPPTTRGSVSSTGGCNADGEEDSPQAADNDNDEEDDTAAFRRRVASASSTVLCTAAASATAAAAAASARRSSSTRSNGTETAGKRATAAIVKANSTDSPELKNGSARKSVRNRINSVSSSASTTSSPQRPPGSSSGRHSGLSSVAAEFARASQARWSLSSSSSFSKSQQQQQQQQSNSSSTFSTPVRTNSKTGSIFSPLKNGKSSKTAVPAKTENGFGTSNGGGEASARNGSTGAVAEQLEAQEKRQMFARSRGRLSSLQQQQTSAKPAAVTANRTMIYYHDYDPDYK